jgi:hypothetical protein
MTEEVNFETLNIQIPNIIKNYSLEKQREIFDYLSELDDINKKGYNIAFEHLGSSFDICRSNGFQKWKQTKISK